jgi:flagellar hook assembly protein FlgD
MSNIKDILGEMNKGQSSSGQYQALNLIGKIVAGDSGKIERAAGEKLHPISFTLNEPAQELKISIKDAEGKVIKSMELQNQPKGNVKIDWDGKNIEGREQVPGTYKVSVEAKSVSGSKVPVDMQFKGAVTGIQFTEKGPIVFVGNKQVPLKEIKQIEVDDKAEVAGLPGAMPQQAQQAQQALGQMAPSQQGKKFISADQLSPDQQKGLEQALAALKGQGFSPAAAAQNPLTDPTQEVLASAIHNQEMKNQKL